MPLYFVLSISTIILMNYLFLLLRFPCKPELDKHLELSSSSLGLWSSVCD